MSTTTGSKLREDLGSSHHFLSAKICKNGPQIHYLSGLRSTILNKALHVIFPTKEAFHEFIIQWPKDSPMNLKPASLSLLSVIRSLPSVKLYGTLKNSTHLHPQICYSWTNVLSKSPQICYSGTKIGQFWALKSAIFGQEMGWASQVLLRAQMIVWVSAKKLSAPILTMIFKVM